MGRWLVSQKSRNFSGLFRVPNLPLRLRNAEVLGYQTLQFLLVFRTLKTCVKISFSKQVDAFRQMAFQARRVLGSFEKQAPGIHIAFGFFTITVVH